MPKCAIDPPVQHLSIMFFLIYMCGLHVYIKLWYQTDVTMYLSLYYCFYLIFLGFPSVYTSRGKEAKVPNLNQVAGITLIISIIIVIGYHVPS